MILIRFHVFWIRFVKIWFHYFRQHTIKLIWLRCTKKKCLGAKPNFIMITFDLIMLTFKSVIMRLLLWLWERQNIFAQDGIVHWNSANTTHLTLHWLYIRSDFWLWAILRSSKLQMGYINSQINMLMTLKSWLFFQCRRLDLSKHDKWSWHFCPLFDLQFHLHIKS